MNMMKVALFVLAAHAPLVMAQQATPIPDSVSPSGAGGTARTGAPAPPPDTSDSRTMVGVSGSYENLSGTQPSWHDYNFRLNKNFGGRRIFDGALTRSSRFDRDDNQISGMYSTPITSQLSGSLQGSYSPTHRVLAKYSLGGAFQYEFTRGWLGHGGLKTTEFNDVRVNQGLLMLEHYFSNFSWAVALRPSRAFGTGANSTELRGGYYYGDRNSVSISLSGGREASNVGTGVVLADVRTIAIFGRHWLNNNWSANYAIGHTRQGDFYNRNGITVGLDYAF